MADDPSKPLKNDKHEAFVRGLAKGLSGRAAYEAAGYTAANERVADSAASRLLTDVKVVNRLNHLKAQVTEKVTEKVALNRAWVIERLMRNARICLGEEKIKIIKVNKETGEITEVEIFDRDPSSANKALELLGKTKELRLWIEQHEHGEKGAFNDMTTDQLRKFVDEKNKQLGLLVKSVAENVKPVNKSSNSLN